MFNAKKEVAKIIVDSYNNQESYESFKEANKKTHNLSLLKENLLKEMEQYDESTKEFLSDKVNDFDVHISELKANNKGLTKENLEGRNAALVGKYMEVSQKGKMNDVMFDFSSTYPGGTKTFKDIIKKLNKDGAGIEYIYENHTGRNTSEPFGGKDTHFVVTMPASSYASFNDEIHIDQENSRFDVIGERKEYFLVPHLNQDVTLETMKSVVEKSIVENGYASDSFNKELSMGYVEIMGSNRDSKSKIERAINSYFSQIKAMENEGLRDGIHYSATKNIMTSAYEYNKNIENKEYAGKPLTPFKEAKRLLPEVHKLKSDSKRKLKNN